MLEGVTQGLGEDWLLEVDDVLQDVIPKRILYERERILGDLAD